MVTTDHSYEGDSFPTLQQRYKVLEKGIQALLDAGFYPRQIKEMAKVLYKEKEKEQGKGDEK